MGKVIPVNYPVISQEAKDNVNKALDDVWISSSGNFVKEFEDKFAEWLGVKHAIAVSSGTAALHITLRAMGIGQGDEVIVPAFTMGSCWLAVMYTGATPVFVDASLNTWCIDTESIERKITKRTKAIMPVHIYGQSCDMGKVMEIANFHGLKVIEDSCQGLGAYWRDKKCGTFGDIACFSFYANKLISCFPGDTNILIKPPIGKQGLSRMKKIKDLMVGERVLTYNEKTSEKEYKKITKIFNRSYKGKILKVFFSNKNDFILTPEHPVYVINKGWVNANKLKIDDRVIQYGYRGGLAYREKYKGERYKHIMGEEKADKKRNQHSKTIKKIHKDKSSSYNNLNWKKIGKKISISKIGKRPNMFSRKKMSKAHKARWKNMSSSEREKFSKNMKDIQGSPDMRLKRSKIAKKLCKDPVYIKKVSDGVKKAMKKESYWKNYIKGMNMKPNKPEKFLIDFLNKNFPNEFSYNGDYRMKVRIDNLIPDFVNSNGKNKIIDVLGRYWHSEDEYDKRIGRYKKHNYDSLMLWEDELKNEKWLKNKIETFIYNPNIDIVKIVNIQKLDFNNNVYNIETEDNHNYFARGILVHNCGEGGMVVTNDDRYAEQLRRLKNLCFTEKRFIHDDVGYNYRMTNLQAAVGCGEMGHIDEYRIKKFEIAKIYNDILGEVNGVKIPLTIRGTDNIYWMYGILIDELAYGITRDKLRETLRKNYFIDTRDFFYPPKDQPILKTNELHMNANYLSRNGLYLPSGLGTKAEDIEYVAKTIVRLQKDNY